MTRAKYFLLKEDRSLTSVLFVRVVGSLGTDSAHASEIVFHNKGNQVHVLLFGRKVIAAKRKFDGLTRST
jgi:hypothetical protein